MRLQIPHCAWNDEKWLSLFSTIRFTHTTNLSNVWARPTYLINCRLKGTEARSLDSRESKREEEREREKGRERELHFSLAQVNASICAWTLFLHPSMASGSLEIYGTLVHMATPVFCL